MAIVRLEQARVKGWLHEAEDPSGDALALTHGAGSNCEAPLMQAVAAAFAHAGISVLRFDLAFRQERRHAPVPAQAARDRESIRQAVEALRRIVAGRVFLGGHSYGGRQSSMAAAEIPALADALLLLSYPLHPPRKPDQLRTAHFPKLETPALFVHGSRDPFGSIGEMRHALASIPAPADLVEVEGAPHGLPPAAAAALPGYLRAFLASGAVGR